MAGETPSGLTPLNKYALSGEVKPNHIYPKNSAEVPDKNELLPEADRVQISREIQSSSSAYQLTSNTNLNQYIKMIEQSKYSYNYDEIDEISSDIKAEESKLDVNIDLQA